MKAQLLLLQFVLFYFGYSIAQEKQVVTITGFAPTYVGAKIEFNEIEDYISMQEATMASTTVQADSTFSVSFYLKETQQIIIRGKKNRTFIYVQPGGVYDLYLPDKDAYEPYRPNGNNVEVTFFSLDTTDINYKILRFQRWLDNFIGNNYHLRSHKPIEFAKKVDEFKDFAEATYAADSTDIYFKTFIRYSIAAMDNIQYAADRNRYEKHDFYLKNFPVSYKNDAYMGYLNSFYTKMMPRLSMETNNRVYLGVLKSSPTLVMRALGDEYTMINIRIREIVMIKALSEAYYDGDLPQTNVMTILDSVANHSLFEANGIIAKNMIRRLTELVPGGKAPDFALKSSDGTFKTRSDFKGKHVYIHFMDPLGQKSAIEIDPLVKLYQTYKDDIRFITVYPSREDEKSKEVLAKIPWEKFAIDENASILKAYKVETFPYYVLLDEIGHVVAAPALTPMPSGQYETIDRTFFYIQKALKELKEYRR
jgi:hypothetical protein